MRDLYNHVILLSGTSSSPKTLSLVSMPNPWDQRWCTRMQPPSSSQAGTPPHRMPIPSHLVHRATLLTSFACRKGSSCVVATLGRKRANVALLAKERDAFADFRCDMFDFVAGYCVWPRAWLVGAPDVHNRRFRAAAFGQHCKVIASLIPRFIGGCLGRRPT